MAVRNALAVGLIALALPARAQTVDVVVKTALDPAQGAVVGQAVELYVDVLFPGTMPRPPRVRIPDVQGAQVMRFESQGVTIGENSGGRNYVGQRFTFDIFPRRGGALTLPAAEVTLLDVAGDVSGSTRGNPVRLDVAVPQGVDASEPVIASTRVTAVQTWAPDPATGLAPGGAIVRTITREAADVPALGMPELTFATPDGVRAYVGSARERGSDRPGRRHGPSHRQGHLCVRTLRRIRPSGAVAALVGPRREIGAIRGA